MLQQVVKSTLVSQMQRKRAFSGVAMNLSFGGKDRSPGCLSTRAALPAALMRDTTVAHETPMRDAYCACQGAPRASRVSSDCATRLSRITHLRLCPIGGICIFATPMGISSALNSSVFSQRPPRPRGTTFSRHRNAPGKRTGIGGCPIGY